MRGEKISVPSTLALCTPFWSLMRGEKEIRVVECPVCRGFWSPMRGEKGTSTWISLRRLISCRASSQVSHQVELRPGRYLSAQISINAIQPLFCQAHRLDAFFQHDLLRRLGKALTGQPSPMRLRPSRPAL